MGFLLNTLSAEYNIFYITAATFILIITYIVASYLWSRRHLYKLAKKIPGPPSYPILGNILEVWGDFAHVTAFFETLFKENQPICKFWMGPFLFIGISKPEHLQIVLNNPYCLGKSFFYRYSEPFLGTGLVSAPVKKWKVRRKMISPIFGQKNLNGFVDIFNEQCHLLVKELDECAGKGTFNIYEKLTPAGLNAICQTVMGVSVVCKGYESEYAKWLDQMFKGLIFISVRPWYYLEIVRKNSPAFNNTIKALSELIKFALKVFAERKDIYDEKIEALKNGQELILQENTGQKCLLDMLLELYDEENNKLSRRDVIEEVNTFISAGTETTPSTISNAVVLLGMYPNIQQNVLDEVLSVVGPFREITADDLPKLKYTERVVKETLRLFPVIPLVGRNAEKDIDLGDGYILPEGSTLILNSMYVQRNPQFWEDPLKFDPDRFMPEKISSRHPYTYLPFSGGPRDCIGRKYGLMLAKTMVACIVRRYHIETTYKNVEDIKYTVAVVIKPTHGHQVSLKLRD